jgi:hypothetical protein
MVLSDAQLMTSFSHTISLTVELVCDTHPQTPASW